MQHCSVAILGGGLSGLYAASMLERQGVDYLLLEARDCCGGRIHSPAIEGAGFDLGASWLWPELQPDFASLLQRLGLPTLPQPAQGDMLMQVSAGHRPLRLPGIVEYPQGLRLAGGMATLTDTLQLLIEPSRLLTGHAVQQLQQCADGSIKLLCQTADGQQRHFTADQILLAIPPRLALQRIRFVPALPASLQGAWRSTATWMAGHAKYIAVYAQPFWRAQGLSGRAGSRVGPLIEIHDASATDGPAALFGFLGLPAQQRQQLGEEALRAACRAQLVQLFGAQAASPRHELFKDWASDQNTATPDDLDAGSQHSLAPPNAADSGPWHGRLTGIASEWSTGFSGYAAGAIQAASTGVRQLLAQRSLHLPSGYTSNS